MGKSSEQHIQMQQDEQGIPMEWSAPKEPSSDFVQDYSLNEFEQLTEHHSKYKPDVKKVILDAIKEYKRIINTF